MKSQRPIPKGKKGKEKKIKYFRFTETVKPLQQIIFILHHIKITQHRIKISYFCEPQKTYLHYPDLQNRKNQNHQILF